ncbi:LysM domain-containing protein [Shewanella indica]|uniref:LysM peptidoglycan-binding domain-containing protein n=1 Tax=Shewanella indica TaxID=768528 RepID=UPI0030069512
MEAPMKRLILLALLTFNCTFAAADTLTLKPGHPDTYVVKKGDTLWDISALFLKDPWRWPKLWGANPQIANPHLIYPGDRLTLVFIDGEPRLVNKPHVRKTPAGRAQPKGGAIPAVDLALIQPYLVQNRVVDPEWFKEQPMVLGGERDSRHHVMDDIIYIQANLPQGDKVGMYQPGREFTNKESGELLGQEVILSASGRVVESGEISKVKLLNNFRETKAGFRVLAIEDDSLLSAYFIPKASDLEGAKVLASERKIRAMGKLDVFYLDRGNREGVEPGDVFSIYKDGAEVVINGEGIPVPPTERSAYDNLMAKMGSDNAVKLPDLYRGQVMVFKVFDKTALGLIMVNESPVRVDDLLVRPDTLLKGE